MRAMSLFVSFHCSQTDTPTWCSWRSDFNSAPCLGKDFWAVRKRNSILIGLNNNKIFVISCDRQASGWLDPGGTRDVTGTQFLHLLAGLSSGSYLRLLWYLPSCSHSCWLLMDQSGPGSLLDPPGGFEWLRLGQASGREGLGSLLQPGRE